MKRYINFLLPGLVWILLMPYIALAQTPPPTPATPTVSTNTCGSKTVSWNGTPPTKVTWYWQTSASGTSMADNNPSKTAATTGTYYLRAYNFFYGVWSTNSASVYVTINTYPSAPATPSFQNFCTEGVLTRGTPPGGVTWYWQTSASGTSTANSNPTYTVYSSGTYYLRARNTNSDCWSSTSTAVTATLTAPPSTPGNPTASSNSCGDKVLTRNGTPPHLTFWYWQTSSGGTSTANSTAELNVTSSGTYYIRAYDPNTGCWSTGAGQVSVTINPIPSGVVSATNGDALCGPATVSLSAGYGSNANSIRWYTTSSGGSSEHTGTSYSPFLNSTTTYYTSSYNTTTGCESTAARVAVTGTVYAKPGLPSPTAASREEPGTVTLTSTIGTNAIGNRWYDQSSGGTLLSTSQHYSPSVSGTTTFYVSSFRENCEGERTPVVATVYPKPVIATTGGTEFNMGNTITLSVSNNTYTSYSWKRDGQEFSTASSVEVNQPGNYTVTVTKTTMTNAGTSDAVSLVRTLDQQPALNRVIVNQVIKDGITTTTDMENLPVGDRQRSVTYLGGLGNTLQTIVSQGSPLQKDIVQPQQYDEHGRQLISYLPYISTTNDSKYRANALDNSGYTNSEQYVFYQTTGQKRATDTKPYSTTEVEPSPLGRVKSQTGVGNDWYSNNKKNSMEYLLNRATDNIRLWKVNGSGMPVSSTYYGNYQLHLTISTDENGHKVKMYTDKLGRTIQKQVEKASGQWLVTTYIYNDLGQLAYVISPQGMATLPGGTPNDTFLNQWAFRYKYDELGRLVEYRAPGADWLYTVYDKLDRPVLKQDANLRSTASWSFIKYDRNGRAVLTGIKAISGSTRTSVQTSVNGQSHMFEITENSVTGYTLNRTFPTVAETDLLTVSYHDNYNFISYTGWDAESHSFSLVQELGHTAYSTRVAGLPTGGKVRMVGIGVSTWLNAVQYYDDRYRPIQMLTENQLNGLDRTTIKYNNLKQVTETKAVHNGNETVTVVRKMEYDHGGRIEKIYQNINSAGSDQLVAQYEYNELGQLVDKKLHDTGSGNFIQSVDYRYTIRGWLESINNPTLSVDNSNDETNDYFGMKLIYQKAEAGLSNVQQYDGSISAITYKGPGGGSGPAEQRSYKYGYDASDRLLTATSQVYTGSTWTGEANALNENMTYDNNGNMLTLARNQRKHQLSGINASYVSEAIDNLTYTYASGSGNRLTKVEDSSGRAEGFTNGSTATTEYTYNNDGNLTADLNKGISSVIYNKLGKGETINFSDGRKIEYTYNAMGQKLTMKLLLNGNPQLTTQYVGDFVYENSALKFFGSPEGRVVKNGSTFEYQYAIGDHQNNTRVVFTSVTPEADDPETSFETSTNSDFGNYINRSSLPVMNRTPSGTYSQLLNAGYNSQVGATRNIKVYPGDKIKAEAYAKYWNTTSTTGNLAGFAAALTGAFGVSSSSTGEGAQIFEALDAFGAFIAGDDRPDDDNAPKGFITILLFDKAYNFLDAAWEQLDEDYMQTGIETNYPFDHLLKEVTVKEEGYAFIFVSNENLTQVDIHFDDMKVTHTKSNVIQYNEYYPFGLQASTSWTRENTTGNNYLYNKANELNTSTGWYEMYYRDYDPTLGKMLQVDPYAAMYSSYSPYNYVSNNPAQYSDPTGGYMEGYQEMLAAYQAAGSFTYPSGYRGRVSGFDINGNPMSSGGTSQWSNNIGLPGWTLYGDNSRLLMTASDAIKAGLRSQHGGHWSNGYYSNYTLSQAYSVSQYYQSLGYGSEGNDYSPSHVHDKVKLRRDRKGNIIPGSIKLNPNWQAQGGPNSYTFDVLHSANDSFGWDWFLETTVKGNVTTQTAVIITYNTNKKDWGSSKYGRMVDFIGKTRVITQDATGNLTTKYVKYNPTSLMDEWIQGAKDYHCGGCLSAPTVWDKYWDFILGPKDPPKKNRLNSGAPHN